MTIELVMSPRRLIVPSTAEDDAKLRTVKPGNVLFAEANTRRNGPQHRRWWALLNFVCDNRDGMTPTQLNAILLIATRNCDTVVLRNGSLAYIPMPTNFRECSQAKFDAYLRAAEPIVWDEYLAGVDRAKVESWIERGMTWNG